MGRRAQARSAVLPRFLCVVVLAQICGLTKRLRGWVSPDGVLLHILQNPACIVVILINDQVPISVMAGVKVSDHSGGNPQAPHHCRRTERPLLWVALVLFVF